MKELCRKIEPCEEVETIKTSLVDNKNCEPFSICFGFGRQLVYDGSCFYVKGTPLIPDGTYGKIIVQDGCIVDALPADVCEYTPGTCVPAAADCNGGSSNPGGGSGSGVVLKSDICNLLQEDAAGRLGAYLAVDAGPGITLSGCGTIKSPLVISASGNGGSSSSYIMTADKYFVDVSGSGTLTDPFVIEPQPVITPGTYCGVRVNRYGQVLGCDGGSSPIQAILGENGIDATTTNGVTSVKMIDTGVTPGDYTICGTTLSVDITGRITKIDDNSGNTNSDNLGINHAVCHITDPNSNMHTCSITTTMAGYLYINWHGRFLDSQRKMGTTDDWVPGWALPCPDFLIGGMPGGSTDIMYNFVNGIVTEFRCRSTSSLAPGSYTVQVHGQPDAGGNYYVIGRGVLEVYLVQ